MPLHLRDMWISTDDYKDVLFTCPVCSKKTVRVCRQLKTVTVLIVPVLPVYTNKVLRCSQCDWHEPANLDSIYQRRSHDDDLPTSRSSEDSARSDEKQAATPNARFQSQNPFSEKSEKGLPSYAYK
ncbi:hypothetical protein POMI540_4740 [Schizosaccharomyces pombe]